MGFYLDICNNSRKYKYLDSLSEDKFVNCIHIDKKPNYFKADEKFNDYITNYNQKFDLFFLKCEFEEEFINYTDFIKTEFFSTHRWLK